MGYATHALAKLYPASAKWGGLLFAWGILPPPFGPASLSAPLLRRSGYFLLATQEKVTRPPQEDESSWL